MGGCGKCLGKVLFLAMVSPGSEVTLRGGGRAGVGAGRCLLSSPNKGEAQSLTAESSHVISWRERVFFEKARRQPSPCVILVLPHRW